MDTKNSITWLYKKNVSYLEESKEENFRTKIELETSKRSSNVFEYAYTLRNA